MTLKSPSSFPPGPLHPPVPSCIPNFYPNSPFQVSIYIPDHPVKIKKPHEIQNSINLDHFLFKHFKKPHEIQNSINLDHFSFKHFKNEMAL